MENATQKGKQFLLDYWTRRVNLVTQPVISPECFIRK